MESVINAWFSKDITWPQAFAWCFTVACCLGLTAYIVKHTLRHPLD